MVLTGGRPENRAAQIAYEVHSATTAKCEHFVPMERAMRRSGMDARLLPESDFGSVIAVKCRNYPVFVAGVSLLRGAISSGALAV